MNCVPHRPARRAGAVIVLAAVVLLAVSGCGTIRAFTDLQGELDKAGFEDILVTVGGDPVALVVKVSSPDERGVETAQGQVARIAWTTFPRKFEEIKITVDGNDTTFTRAELRTRFGPRPSGLDDDQIEDDITRVGVGGLIALLVGAVLCAGLAVLIGVLLWRRRSRAAAAAGPPTPWMPVAQVGGPSTPAPSARPGPTGPITPVAAPSAWPSGPTPVPVGAAGKDPDARRFGRRPRGPAPPREQQPPGWG